MLSIKLSQRLTGYSQSKREPQCLRCRITICCRKQEQNQEHSALHWVSVLEKKPERALRTWKQPAWLHLKKKSWSVQETRRQAQYCAARGGHSSGTSSRNWGKWLLRSGCLSENSQGLSFFLSWAACSLVLNAKVEYKMKQKTISMFSNCLHVNSCQSA